MNLQKGDTKETLHIPRCERQANHRERERETRNEDKMDGRGEKDAAAKRYGRKETETKVQPRRHPDTY